MTAYKCFAELTWVDAALVALYTRREELQSDSPHFVACERAIYRLQGMAGWVGIEIPNIAGTAEELELRDICFDWARRLAFSNAPQTIN
jgi:hypothetical protein